MSKTTTIRVRLKNQNHPTGERRRAGFVVTVQPTVIEVTDEQLEILQGDNYIQILPAKGKIVPSNVPTNPNPEDIVTPLNSKTPKVELIRILVEELEQTPEQDFDPTATNKALLTLIETLREERKNNDGDDQGGQSGPGNEGGEFDQDPEDDDDEDEEDPTDDDSEDK